MKKFSLAFLLTFALGGIMAQGATISVGSGQSIQAAINSASAGDVLNLTAPVSYNGDLNVTKPLRIVSLLTANQSIGGNIYIENVPDGQSVTLKNISVAGTVDIKNSSVNILKCTLSSYVTAVNPASANTQLNFVQSNIIGKLTSKTSRSWIGYSNLRQSAFEGIVEIVGNDFNGSGLGGIGIDLNGTHTVANIHNNLIHDFSLHNDGQHSITSNTCIGIRVRNNARAEIRNNSIKNNKDSAYNGTETYAGMGIYVESTALTTISSNLLTHNYIDKGNQTGANFVEIGNTQVYAPKTNVVMGHNALDRNPGNHSALVKGGVEHYDTVSSTAEGSGFLSNTVAKMAGKPGQNTGSPDDYHKDHDGSRNDIGPNGGRNYVPDGRTTDKPIPIFFSVAPEAVPVGGTITIKSTGATVK
jgi:hypothetical protein